MTKQKTSAFLGVILAVLMLPAYGVVLQQNNFDGDSGNDIGSGFVISAINDPLTMELTDAATGVISFSSGDSRPNVTLVSSTALDLSAEDGFTVTWNIESIASDNFTITKNGMFLGVQTANNDAWNNITSLGIGIRSSAGSGGDLDLIGSSAGTKILESALVATITDDSIKDGFTATLTVNSDNTWSASTTGLSTDADASGVLSNVTYSQLAGTLFAGTALQLNKFFSLHTITCDSMSVEVPSDSAALMLAPSDQLDMLLAEPSTVVSGTVNASFSYGPSSNNVQITSVDVVDQQHTNAFSVVGFTAPQELTDPASPATLNIQFDVTGTGLAGGDTSTGIIEVVWNEIGGDSKTNTLPVSVLIQAQDGAVWTTGGSFVGDDNQNNISLEGILVEAVNFGGNTGDLAVVVNNGTKTETITFTDNNDLFGNSAYDVPDPGTGDANWNSVISRSDYSQNNSPCSFEITGLSAGQLYQIEFFVWDTRNYDIGERTFSLDDSKGNSSATYKQSDGVSVIGTFTADASNQTFRISQSAGSPNMNAYVLRALGGASAATVAVSAGAGGTVSISASEMSAFYTYTLQGNDDLEMSADWVDITATTGVETVSWNDLPATNSAQFYRVISE